MSATVLRHPARVCWDAAHAVAAKRGASLAAAEHAARRTWEAYRAYRVPADTWPVLVVAALPTK